MISRLISKRASNERMIRELYRSLLGRDVDAGGLRYFLAQLAAGCEPHDVSAQIMASPEFQVLLDRRAAAEHERPTKGFDLGPAPAFDIQVVIATRDGFAKIAEQVKNISAQLHERDILLILGGSRGRDECCALQPGRVEMDRFPGDSVLHLRMRLPTAARHSRWVALIEDHVSLPPDWLDHLRRIIHSGDNCGTQAYFGAMANLTSTGRWAWASFLMTFARTWHPVQDLRVVPLIANNVTFRRDDLPEQDFQFAEFESSFMAKLSPRAVLVNEVWANHVQPASFVEATSMHYHTGRVTGAHIRMNAADTGAMLKTALRHILRERTRLIRSIVQDHPRRNVLPRFTLQRVRWLTAAVAVGLVFGSWFGHGRSPWQLQ